MIGINTAAMRHAAMEMDSVAKLVDKVDVQPYVAPGASGADPALTRLLSDATDGLDRVKQQLRDAGVIDVKDWGSSAPGASLLPHIESDVVHLRSRLNRIRDGVAELRSTDPTRSRSLTDVVMGDRRDPAAHARAGKRLLDEASGLKSGVKFLFDAPTVQAERMQTAARLGDSLDRAGVRMLHSPTELTMRLERGAPIDSSDDGIRALAHLAHKERLMDTQTYRGIVGDARSAPSLPPAWQGEDGAARMVDDLRDKMDARSSGPRWYPENHWL